MIHLKPTLRCGFYLAFACGLILSGCASTPPAPVEDRGIGSPRARVERGIKPSASAPVARGDYRVQRGDTLYSIAFRHGLDYRELARLNRIESPYTIFVGQELRLAVRPPLPERVTANTPARRPVPASMPSPRAAGPAPFENASAKPALPGSIPLPPTGVAAGPPPAKPDPVVAVPNLSAAPDKTNASAGVSWRWPADGARVGGFVAGDQTRQGVDIAGKAGDAVRAAADGQVVYSGNGLIGYGELIIVKHSSSLLSAYGHNRRRLVQEGATVKAGQQIAEMGSSSASRDMLHFEIRRNGKPVDPMDFLPAR